MADNDMFGVIVSGRMAQTDFQQLSERQVLTTIVNADNINHVVVFMTGSQAFPEGCGGAVYFSWPDPFNPPSWHYLGYITNEKPSAIFQINGLKQQGGMAAGFSFGQQSMSHNAQIGISLEPLAQIQALTASVTTSTQNEYVKFTECMLESLYNFAASWSSSASGMTPVPNETYLPMSQLNQWYQNFLRRLQLNPNFWKN